MIKSSEETVMNTIKPPLERNELCRLFASYVKRKQENCDEQAV